MSAPTAPPAPPPPPPYNNPLTPRNGAAIAALIIGIVAFLLGLIPVLGLALGVSAVVVAVVGLRRVGGRGAAVAGLVLGAVAGLTGLVTTAILIVGVAAGTGKPAALADDAAPSAPSQTLPTASDSHSSSAVASAAPAASTASTQAAAATVSPAPKPVAGADYGGYTKTEAKFVSIVESAETKFTDTDNDLKASKVLADRDAAACSALSNGAAKGWVGTIHDLGATGDGDGYVEIEIAPTIVVQTWNNAFSDTFDHTLIPGSSTLFDKLSDMNTGDKVKFFGKFVPSSSACDDTTNLTKTFNAEDPNFLFRFSSVTEQ